MTLEKSREIFLGNRFYSREIPVWEYAEGTVRYNVINLGKRKSFIGFFCLFSRGTKIPIKSNVCNLKISGTALLPGRITCLFKMKIFHKNCFQTHPDFTFSPEIFFRVRLTVSLFICLSSAS